MTEINQIYKCQICGNLVDVKESGAGTLVCCGQDMELLSEKTKDKEGKEKHVPIIEISGKNVTVKVGSIEHPMEEKHFIEYIEILKDNIVLASKQLRPGQKPEAKFCLDDTDGIYAREICNVHGLWRS